MKTPKIFVIATALLVGCATTEPDTAEAPKLPPMRPVAVGGTYVEPSQLECLRHAETAKGYAIGRFIDPSDETVMHERSVVYRVENGAAWNLQAKRPVDVPFDGTPKAHVYRDERELRAEMTAKANKQREYYEMMRAAQLKAMAKMDAFRKTVEQARKLAEMNEHLIREIRKTQGRNAELEDDVRKLNAKVKVLLDCQKLSEESDSRYKYLRK